jgi:hypothetical protein
VSCHSTPSRLRRAHELSSNKSYTLKTARRPRLPGLITTSTYNVLAEIGTLATTVKNNGEKIVTNAGTLRKKIDDQLNTLIEHVQALRRVEQN